METFVSDLLENADLGVITKKDVRMKYKSFIGRDISAEEKAKINDLVYAFVYYYAAKLKKSKEKKEENSGLSVVDKENKRKHVKEKSSKNGKESGPNKLLVLKGQMSDKHNIKKRSLSDEEYKEEKDNGEDGKIVRRNRGDRKSYPIRKRKESTWLQLADAVSAIMTDSESNSDDSGSDSSESDSEPEKDEEEKEQIRMVMKKLQKQREMKIQISLTNKERKKAKAAKTGKNISYLKNEKEIHVKTEGSVPSPITVSSEDSVILLSDISPEKKTNKITNVSEKKLNKKPKSDSEKKKKKEVSPELKKKVFKGSHSDDSSGIKVKKTSGNYSKIKEKGVHSQEVKGKLNVKKNKLKKEVLIETETESELDKPVKKKAKLSKLSSQGKKLITLAQLRKKLMDANDIKKLVKKKREAAALKKLRREKKRSESDTKSGKQMVKSSSTLNCDNSNRTDDQLSDFNSTESETDLPFGRSLTLMETDCSSDIVSSEVSERLKDTDSIVSTDSSNVEVTGEQSVETDSPIKVTPGQLAKKKRQQMELASDDEIVKKVPKKSKSVLSKKFENKMSDSDLDKSDGFVTLDVKAKCHLNKNGVCIISEESSSDEDEPLSQTKAKIQEKKQNFQEPEPHHLQQLRKICRISGIFVRSDRELKDCSTNDEKITTLKKVLKDAGMKGQPSMKKAEELKLQKEASELSVENIISPTETATGRARRNVRSIYSMPKILSSDPDSPEISKRGALFEKLKELRESENSE